MDIIIGSYSLSLFSIGGEGSLNNHKGTAKFINEFFILETYLFKTNLITSIPTAPTTIAVVVAMAGIILPAIIFTLNLSTSGIL